MHPLSTFFRSGHWPTLVATLVYFTFSCGLWVMKGAMAPLAPFISETYQLTGAHKGLMLSVPIFAGALMRFPLGVLAQYPESICPGNLDWRMA